MSAMRVLRFASAARAGIVSRPSSLWRPTKCAWMFGRLYDRPRTVCQGKAEGADPVELDLSELRRLLGLRAAAVSALSRPDEGQSRVRREILSPQLPAGADLRRRRRPRRATPAVDD